MIDKIKPLEVKKAEYRDILQVAELFYADRLAATIYNAMTYIVNFTIDERKKDGDSFPMMIHTGIYEAVNIEYNLFVKALSMNYSESTQKSFLLDFSIREGIREDGNMRGPLFLCNGILRKYLKLLTELKSYPVKRQGVAMNIDVVNFYVPVIYEREGVCKQMSAITMRLDSLVNIITEIPSSGALYKAIELFSSEAALYEQKAFGAKKCNFFWFQSGKHKSVLFKSF